MQTKQYNYHKLCRKTNGFTKKPSVREILDRKKTQHKTLEKEIARNQYCEYERNNMKFGIFNKKGYRPIELFITREEAEQCLSHFRKPEYYDIREIQDFTFYED